MAAAVCRSNCRACRSSIARGILPAIAASASAAISTAWRGLPRCAAMNCSIEPAAAQPLSADIVPARFRRRFAQPRIAVDRDAASSRPPPAELPRADCIRDFTPNRFGNARGNPQNEDPDGNAEERVAVPPARRCQIAVADAGRKQRLQRTRAAIVGAARKRKGARRNAEVTGIDETVVEEPASRGPARRRKRSARPRSRRNGWRQPEPPARGEARRDKALLDLLPVGILIYRLDRLLYANPAFLDADGLSEPARAGGCRRPRCALCRARRLERLAARRTPARR